MAQTNNTPLWMEHIVRDKIIKKDFIESQKILDPYSISTVRITMSASDYTKLINDVSSNDYLLANFTYESPAIPLQTIEQVGIRIRGAASRSAAKKSFKISFDSFGHDDRKFYSLKKLNLNCDFQDPHLMRAKTCTDLFRLMGVEAARTGYAKLYINGDYRGLFDNYEEFDKSYLSNRFGDKNGNLYKGDGASMEGGRGGLELTTNETIPDYSDIIEFTKVLNNTPSGTFKEKIERVFNVDEMLMFTACNVLLGAWDDYWNLAKNFYFYHDPSSDQFNYIPHDFDGSLGTDWYYGSITDGNVYNWSRNSGRPMIDKLLQIPEYRDRYTHFLMLLCKFPFSLEAMEPEIDRTAKMIRGTLTTDPYWGWNPADFDKAFTQAIPQGSVKYGMKEYINLRQSSALKQLEQIGPYIKPINRLPLLPTEIDPVTISQLVIDRATVSRVQLVYKAGDTTGKIDMLDDGAGKDEKANDYIYSAQIPALANADQVFYYVEATNSTGQISRYPYTDQWATYSINYKPAKIVFNEVLALNVSKTIDTKGEFEDWFELYNPGDQLVDLMGMYVSDDLTNPRKWRLGNIIIPAKGFIRLWADEDPEQGADHVGFKLSEDGEELGLFDTDDHQNLLIDKLQFGPQTADVSYGRIEDGAQEWVFFNSPTPGRGNNDSTPIPGELADITNLGGQITEANNNSPSAEMIANLIDNNTASKYLTFKENTWIKYSLDQYSLVNGYAIVSANDAPERDPGSWEFQGYDEETANWVTLHTVTDEPQWESRFESKEYYFANTKRYKSYRLNIISAHGTNIVQMAELEIYGVIKSGPSAVEKLVANTFSIYPNPAHDILNINSDSELKSAVFYDVFGRMVKQMNLNGDYHRDIEISDLKSGVYILKAEFVTGEYYTQKFVRN